MGSGITMTCADAGLPYYPRDERGGASMAMDRIRSTYEVSVKRGSITASKSSGWPVSRRSPRTRTSVTATW